MPRIKTKVNALKIETEDLNQISELNEPIWAAISKTDCFVCNVTYQEALDLSVSLIESPATVVTSSAAKRQCIKPDCSPKVF